MSLKKHPRNHVISMRITDAEKYVLQQVAQRKKMTTSKALREALYLLTVESHYNRGLEELK